ncbi:MAG: biotin synthase BioB [Acidobacteriota bacterium]
MTSNDSVATAPDAASASDGVAVERDWTLEELRELHDLPLPELVYRAQTVHRQHHDPAKVQLCQLLSIKTGACPEDCAYCPQSARFKTDLETERLIETEAVLTAARAAAERGASRFCMGAAWRRVKDGKDFDRVLEMVRGVRGLGLEACCTLGMLEGDQAERLKEAGLTAYNHNLDTGPEYYDKIITTRTFDDRLETLAQVRAAGISVCSGGILGMGESVDDRLGMLKVLAAMRPQPESVPINALVPVKGTPLGEQSPVSGLEMVRMIATTRLALPRSRVRLSAGRTQMTDETQALCFLAGASSIFCGDTLLTTPNPGEDRDRQLLDRLGMEPEAGPPAPARRSEAASG